MSSGSGPGGGAVKSMAWISYAFHCSVLPGEIGIAIANIANRGRNSTLIGRRFAAADHLRSGPPQGADAMTALTPWAPAAWTGSSRPKSRRYGNRRATSALTQARTASSVGSGQR